jgi:hypothetical protein
MDSALENRLSAAYNISKPADGQEKISRLEHIFSQEL